eukprot:184025-Prorocentrum_minimum.AAC.1
MKERSATTESDTYVTLGGTNVSRRTRRRWSCWDGCARCTRTPSRPPGWASNTTCRPSPGTPSWCNRPRTTNWGPPSSATTPG